MTRDYGRVGPDGTWIASNATDDSLWHLGVKFESYTVVTKRLCSTSYRTACSGRQLGGSYGYSKESNPKGERCARCVALASQSKEGT